MVEDQVVVGNPDALVVDLGCIPGEASFVAALLVGHEVACTVAVVADTDLDVLQTAAAGHSLDHPVVVVEDSRSPAVVVDHLEVDNSQTSWELSIQKSRNAQINTQ